MLFKQKQILMLSTWIITERMAYYLEKDLISQQIKKLQIITSFSLYVKYIFADELISGLDLETQLLTNTIIDFLKNERKIILVTHSLDAMNRYTDDIRILDSGELKTVSSRSEIEEYILKTGVIDDKITTIQEYFHDC